MARRPSQRRSNEPEASAEVKALREVRAELVRLSSIIALNSVKDLQQNKQVEFLSKVGFARGEIADMVHTTPHTVDITIQRSRASKKKRKRAPRASD